MSARSPIEETQIHDQPDELVAFLTVSCQQMLTAIRLFRSVLDDAEAALREADLRLGGDEGHGTVASLNVSSGPLPSGAGRSAISDSSRIR